MLTLMLFCNHLLSSLCYFVGDVSKDLGADENWIDVADIEERSIYYRYTTSYQWSFSNFAQGASEVSPTNEFETSISIPVLVFGMLMFNLMNSSVTSSMVRLNSMNTEAASQIWLLRRYLKQYNVPTKLTYRILRFVEYKVVSTKELIHEEKLPVLAMLSEGLRRELKCACNFSALITTHPLFARCAELSEVVVQTMTDEVLSLKFYNEDDVIFSRGKVTPEMQWMTLGSVLYQRQGDKDRLVVPGDWCCEAALFVWWACRGGLKTVQQDSQMIIVDVKSFGEVVQANEVTNALMSAYGAIYVDRLNDTDYENLSDLSRHERGLRNAMQDVEQIRENIYKFEADMEKREEMENLQAMKDQEAMNKKMRPYSPNSSQGARRPMSPS